MQESSAKQFLSTQVCPTYSAVELLNVTAEMLNTRGLPVANNNTSLQSMPQNMHHIEQDNTEVARQTITFSNKYLEEKDI